MNVATKKNWFRWIGSKEKKNEKRQSGNHHFEKRMNRSYTQIHAERAREWKKESNVYMIKSNFLNPNDGFIFHIVFFCFFFSLSRILATYWFWLHITFFVASFCFVRSNAKNYWQPKTHIGRERALRRTHKHRSLSHFLMQTRKCRTMYTSPNRIHRTQL